jgi:hypothetical protein
MYKTVLSIGGRYGNFGKLEETDSDSDFALEIAT